MSQHTRAPRNACATSGHKFGQVQAHAQGPYPCGNGPPALRHLASSTLPAPAAKAQHISPLPKHARQQPTRSQNATGSATYQEGRWRRVRVPGGERGQTWACQAPGWHPTAPASAGAPALGRRGGLGPARPLKQNWVRRTRRGRTRAGRALPPCVTLRRAPSQPMQTRRAARARIALGARAGPQGARECRHPPRGGRGGTWGWPSGQGSTGKMCPPLDEL